MGAESVNDLAARVESRVTANKRSGAAAVHDHVTRMFPKQTAALLDGGSIYWVIKGVVRARQRFLGFESRTGADGVERCAFLLDPEIILTEAQRRRAFQGWRYLADTDVPVDIKQATADQMPPELSHELAELGLL